MKRLLALAAVAVALATVPAHASTIVRFVDPVTRCSWWLSGPDVIVYTGPGPLYEITGGVHGGRTCADPSSNCSFAVEHSNIWVSDHGVTVPNSVSADPGYCWL